MERLHHQNHVAVGRTRESNVLAFILTVMKIKKQRSKWNDCTIKIMLL
jgi:hypothetical protein